MKKKEKAEKELQQARRLRKAMREAGFPHYPWLPSDDGTHWHNTETNETRLYPPSSSSGARRKKKKRRKKKTPKTSSSACRMVRLPWRCHELYGVSVLDSEHSANFVLDCACSWSYGVMVATFIWTLLLSTMLAGFAGDDAPRAVFPSILLVQHTVEIPQLQFICVVVVLPDVTHMPSLMVQTTRLTIEIPQLLVYKVVNVPVMRDVQVPRVRRGEDSCSHSYSSLRKAFLLCRPCKSCRLVVTQCLSLMVQNARRTIEIPRVIRGLHAAGELAGVCMAVDWVAILFTITQFCALRCRLVVKVFLPMMLTILRGTAVCRRRENTLSITSSTKTLLGVFACSMTVQQH